MNKLFAVLCVLSLMGCSSVDTHGLDTHQRTFPVYSQEF